MNYKLLPVCIAIISIIFLFGCSTRTKWDQVSSDIQGMNNKFDQLNNNVSRMHSDLQSAKDDATRANQRLDNQIHSYRK